MSQDYNKLEPGEEVWIYDRSAAPRRHLPTARPIGVADLIVVRVEGVSGHAERMVKMTSLNRARRFVGSGRAVFTGPQAIRFVVDSARTELLQRRAQEAEERLHDRVTGGNYDRIDRVLTLPELARLPLVCPSKILRNERSDRDWSYTAAVRRAARRDHTAEEVAALRGRGGLNPSAEGRP